MDDRGKESVQEAVRLFNYYGQHLGITPFLGKATKTYEQKIASADRAAQARQKALASGASLYR